MGPTTSSVAERIRSAADTPHPISDQAIATQLGIPARVVQAVLGHTGISPLVAHPRPDRDFDDIIDGVSAATQRARRAARTPCGTVPGFRSHRARQEDPCTDCATAWAERIQDLPPIEHGTRNGYVAHYRRNIPYCQPCRDAQTVYSLGLRTRTAA
ncbi:hypothetical protein [Nakamurella leprariae]|uniref:Uncharacterized protein n=1 Tax=Nakamurella leprariae TaxID=2803911 RepID=A0A938YCT7_9ACTN|nr:hypothetical protein [Nakamurella leprariae]MBM9467248.1 hypothetical protein [Nakamurella leprariae]